VAGALASVADAIGRLPLDLALYGGEDYALVAASDQPIRGFSRIGEITEGRGIVLRTVHGEKEIPPGGFDHFSP
jgi:thiamine-monophosphate kinase